MVETTKNHKVTYVGIPIDSITYAEQKLFEWRKQLEDINKQNIEWESYNKGISETLQTLGIDKNGTIAKTFNIFSAIIKQIYLRSVESCYALELSIDMTKALKNENKVLHETLTTMLELPSNAENNEIKQRAEDYGKNYDITNDVKEEIINLKTKIDVLSSRLDHFLADSKKTMTDALTNAVKEEISKHIQEFHEK